MAAAQAAENHGDEWGLTWYLQSGIYIYIYIYIINFYIFYINLYKFLYILKIYINILYL